MLSAAPVPTPIVEPSLSDIEKPFTNRPFAPSPPLPPPKENLDARSKAHVRALVHQALKEVYVSDMEGWEKVIVEVALEIAQDIPYVLDIIGKQNTNSLEEEPLHHIIKITTEPTGVPQDSRYVPGPGEGQVASEDVKKEPRLLELGGTVILNGNAKDLAKVERVTELVVFLVCNLKLEMYLFLDHFATRPEQTETRMPRSPVPPRRIGRSILNWIRGENVEDGSSSLKRSTSPEGIVDGSNRFDRAIRQIEKTIISASPDVVFPPPHLLVRLRDEESSLNALRAMDERRLSYAVEDVDATSKFSSWGSNTSAKKRYSSASLSSRTSHISVDSKAGLGYLMTNNNSINGVIKHQSVTFAYSYYFSGSNIPCRPPEILTIEYYQKSGEHYQDRTLGQFVELLCNKAKGLCPDAMCKKPMGHHVITYTHNRGRISVSVQEAPAGFGSPSNNQQIYMWTGCKECDATTDVIPMSAGSWHYSFAKYLELLYYNPHFVCRTVCPHIDARERVRRFFRLRDQIVIFSYDSIDLFEMRVPKIQVSPDYYFDEAHYLSGSGSDSDGEDIEPFGIDGAQALDSTRMEIMYFYGSVKDYIQSLQSATGASLVAQNQGTPDQVRCQIMLDEMCRRFKADEEALYAELKKTKVAVLNNLRREFVAKIVETMGDLEKWAKDNAECGEVKAEWQLPEYCR